MIVCGVIYYIENYNTGHNTNYVTMTLLKCQLSHKTQGLGKPTQNCDRIHIES